MAASVESARIARRRFAHGACGAPVPPNRRARLVQTEPAIANRDGKAAFYRVLFQGERHRLQHKVPPMNRGAAERQRYPVIELILVPVFVRVADRGEHFGLYDPHFLT